MSWILHKVGRMRLAAFTVLVVISSLSTAAAQPPQRSSAVVDIALSPEGHLISRCEDHEGRPVAGAIVELVRDRDMLSWTTSRSDGSFILRDVSPGTYRIQCGLCDRAVRLWSETAAPPASRVPIVVVVSAASPSPLREEGTLPAVAQEATDTDTANTEPILPLQLLEGSQRRSHAAVEQSVANAAPPVAKHDLPALELSTQNTHAHHTIETAQVDVTFDPFAAPGSSRPKPNETEAVELTEEPLPAPAPAQQPPPELTPTEVSQPGPQQVPPSGGVRYIPRSVGPTVGDVVVTSIGIAGITMGIVAIHKYDNRRIRRVVSP